MINEFNTSPSTVMHIDLNSCFATIEQQANPILRGKPIVVAAYDSPGGCILAASIEAKRWKIKTGMRVGKAKQVCPSLIVLEPDPNKYRHVHVKLRKIIRKYTSNFHPKSIDEFVLHFDGFPIVKKLTMAQIGEKIKKEIREKIGDFISVSVGIGPSVFIAKTASNLKKPDGLEEINSKNFLDIYSRLELVDLNGINARFEARLNNVGIKSVIDFYASPLWKLKAAFASINGYYWYLRLRGWEIDDVVFGRKTFGNSYALPHSESGKTELLPILSRLTEKTGQRLRVAGYKASGISILVSYRDHSFWHKSKTLNKEIFDSGDIYKEAVRVLDQSDYEKTVHTLAVSVFGLRKSKHIQYDLFEDVEKKKELSESIDTINRKWGEMVLTHARGLTAKKQIKDRIAFGGVREL